MDATAAKGMEYVSCNLCGADDSRVLFRVPVRSDQEGTYARDVWDIVRCRQCGLIYTNPRLDAAALDAYYRFDNEFDAQFVQDWFIDNARLQGPTWRRYLSVIQHYAPQGRLLDVGCGAGTFLVEARRSGYDVVGQEVSPFFVEYGRSRHQLQIYAGELEDLPLSKHSFDVATAFDVVEHHPDPRRMLTSMHQLLRPGGLIALSTHDVGNWLARYHGAGWRYINPIGHLTYFTRTTLLALLRSCGFTPVKAGGIHTVDVRRSLEVRNWLVQFVRVILLRSLIIGVYRPLTERWPRLSHWQIHTRHGVLDHRRLLTRAGKQINMNDDMLILAQAQ